MYTQNVIVCHVAFRLHLWNSMYCNLPAWHVSLWGSRLSGVFRWLLAAFLGSMQAQVTAVWSLAWISPEKLNQYSHLPRIWGHILLPPCAISPVTLITGRWLSVTITASSAVCLCPGSQGGHRLEMLAHARASFCFLCGTFHDSLSLRSNFMAFFFQDQVDVIMHSFLRNRVFKFLLSSSYSVIP